VFKDEGMNVYTNVFSMIFQYVYKGFFFQ